MSETAAEIAARRALRRALGLCTECDEPALKGHPTCRRHYEMNRRRSEEYRRRRLENNLCICGERVARGKTRCPECLQLERVRGRLRYTELKEAGKCVTCARRRPLPGKVKCLRCAARDHEYYVNRRDRRRIRLARRGQLVGRVFELHPYCVGAQKR